jgi:hypothetical protein
MRLDEILSIVVVILAIIIAVLAVKRFGKKYHKVLARLVAANIILDIIAMVIWVIFPATQWSIYRLDFSIVGIEATLAAALFALILFGLIKSKKWAPILAIVLTATQRVFATYVFFPSIGNALTLIWSLLILYFAHMDIEQPCIEV